MGTKGNRSSGTQHNPKGVTQGNTLVDYRTGEPISVTTDGNGIRRLAVDASVTASIGNIDVDLDFNEDSVQIGDPNTGFTLKINTDGSIDANVEMDAADGDNIAVSSHPNQIFAQLADTITTSGFEQIFTYTSTNNRTRVINVTSTVSTPSLIIVKINGTIVRELWTSPTERNAIFDFKENRALLNGDVLTVEAKVERFIHTTYETFTSLEGYLN
jgi:hypothetical protein